MALTNDQLAELLVGIARSQKAIIDAVTQHLGQQNGLAFQGNAVIPTLQGAANILNDPRAQPTLHDLPSRILLHAQTGPNPGFRLEEWVAQELNRLAP
ncbi:hypothetical protein [Burkholderia lata]|uniref:hypothetical protein n=1 Tax=Burkholderia lata (strain ATCC 17760 / DSM 23089 / LMG 22485 / NCIMB 9086 / R18194 / 383) TaxID=482957 RepID=UPI001453D190|nr:hypothetical protein [Burkholderia lata]VWB67956.1 hypothetical protein BLA15816_03219 [Burkholderia lata]